MRSPTHRAVDTDCVRGPPDPQPLQASHRIHCLMQVCASAQVACVGEASVTAALARTAAAFGVDPLQPGCTLCVHGCFCL